MRKILIVSWVMMVQAAASHGTLIGDFEGGVDGWNAGSPNTLSNTFTGATLGTQALHVVDPDGGWGGSIEFSLLDQPNAAELVAAATAPGGVVRVDLTTIAGEIPDGWGDMGLLVNAQGYWNVMDWQFVPIGATTSMEFVLDPAAQAAIATGAGINSYANIGLLTNTGSTYGYYADNIQIVPEPASLMLLGLGALALIRRRR